jgi:5-methyltetrahydrofolate--homocysteine methyltransferase
MGEMKTSVQALERSGLRENLKVIIGGAPITDDYAAEIGANAAGKDAAAGVRICKQWIGKT